MTDGKILPRDFYKRDALTVARELIGKTLVRYTDDGCRLAGIISETEAYMGVADRASHAYGGRRTARTETMYLPGGHAYVYLIYGIYSCMNITANDAEIPEAVLIRAVVPYDGEAEMYSRYLKNGRRRRYAENSAFPDKKTLYSITSGPGKLCVSMDIGRGQNAYDMTAGNPDNTSHGGFYVSDEGYVPTEIAELPRVGIDYAGDAASYPWRFTVPLQCGVPAFDRSNKITK